MTAIFLNMSELFYIAGRCKAILRPSLLSATSSGPSSVSSNSRAGFTEGSVGGGAPSPGGADFNCESSTSSQSPTRPRHIKLRNQLHKNNSVGMLQTLKKLFIP